jgi:dihydroflavonol-4-reductase
MKAFLTGATGFVGGHLLDALLAAGAEVRCLVRPSSSRRNLEGRKVELVEGDLRHPQTLAAGLAGCEALFHCAADYRLYSARPRELYESNVEGTRNILRAAAAAGIERVVYTSSVGALGLRHDGRPADETTPSALADMVGHYKRSKYLAERVAERFAENGLPVVIVNPSTPVGDGDLKPTATGRIVLDFLNRRTPAYVDTGLNLIDVRDVAAGHLLAAEKGQVGRKYILGNRNLSLREIFSILSAISGLAAPRLKVPHWLPLSVAAIDTAWARLTGGEPRVALEAVRLARHEMYFDSGRAVRELALPQTPVEEALERAVRWYHDEGYVRSGAG